VALALFLLPVGASAENFKATIDGSFNIYHSGSGNEGYGNAGTSGSFRLDKSHQHMGFMDWDGTVGQTTGQSLGDYIAANPSFEAFVWVKSVSGIGNKIGIVTIRTSNVGNIVEDAGLSGADATAVAGYNVPNSSGAVAFRMADLYTATGYVSTGDGIEKRGIGQFAGEPWKRPSTGNPAGSRSGTPTFLPGQECVSGAFPVRTGFWDGELYGVEGVVGFHWSQASNDPTRFANAGQLVNTDDAGGFRWLDPTCAQADGWYKVKLNNAIVLDMINNTENKGIIFSSWVAGGTVNWGAPAYGNDVVYDHLQAGGIYAPYLEITPEPATMVLLALGGLVALRRRHA